MDIGVALWSLQATAAAPANHARLYRQLPGDARFVERLGYHSMWLSEHRFWYDGWCPAPLVAAGAAAAVTSRLRLGTAMALLPQHDPDRFARAAVTLAHLAGGRVALGVGLGHRDAEFDGLGIERRRRGARMDTALDTLLERWTAAGGDRRDIWIGGMAPAAITRGARRGLSFLLPQTLYVDELADTVSRIRAEAAGAGVPPGRVGLLRDAWLTDDEGERERVLDLLAAHYREEAGSWWILKGQRHGFAAPELLETQLRRITSTPLVGDAAALTGEVERLAEAGVDLLALRFRFDVTREAARVPLERFAREVLPRVGGGGAA